MESTNNQLTDQNTLLKAQLAASGTMTMTNQASLSSLPISTPTELASTVAVTTQTNENQSQELLERIKILESENAIKESLLETIRKDQDDLLLLLTYQDQKLITFKNRLRELGETIEDDDSDNNSADSENES